MRRELGLGEHATIQYDDDGWDSRVYLVNQGEAVFKFPRSPRTKQPYQRELAVLDTLQAIDSPVLVPRVNWRSPDLEWFGYRRIVGQQLSYVLPELDPTTKRAIGLSIGVFLRRTHVCRVEGLATVSVERDAHRRDAVEPRGTCQSRYKHSCHRPHGTVMLVVDEFHALPGADYEQVLGELAKYGANVMLASQTLAHLDRLTDAQRTRNLRATLFSNLDGLFAFHTSAEDAAYLADELGGGLDAQDLPSSGTTRPMRA